MKIIQTRLFPPHKDGKLVDRPSSQLLLKEAAGRRLSLVQAPAGYGKTTTMVECYQGLKDQGQLVAWLSLNDFRGSLTELVYYLLAALRQSVPSFGNASPHIIPPAHETSLSDTAADFCNEFGAVRQPIFLFLDDFHAIVGTEAERLVGSILNDGPGNLHLVIATRAELSFTVGRLRALGGVVKIDVNDLRFSPHDAQQFLALASAGTPISMDLAKLAVRKTEGWPAALQLVTLALDRTSDPTELLESFSGTHRDVGTYLADDILNRLSPALQEFLLHTSILPRFCADLCDAVTERDDSRAKLDCLEKSGLFIFSLDNEGRWYRYHHLFSDFLAKILAERSPASLAALHRRASKWFAQNGLTEEAFRHAILGGDIDHAAALFQQAWYDMYLKGDHWTLTEWVKLMPESVLSRLPKIQLERAWLLILEWRFDEANALIKSVSELMANGTLAPCTGPSDRDNYSLPHLLKHRQMMIAEFADDMPTVEQLSNELLSDFPFCDGFHEGSLHVSLLYAQREHYRFNDVEKLNAKARACFHKAHAEPGKVWHECILGPTYLQLGSLDAAIEGYRRAIDVATRARIGSDEMPLALVPSLLLSDVLIERCELVEARALLDRFLPLARRQGFVDSLIAGYIGRARLAQIDSDWASADKVLTEGFEFALTHSFDRLFWNIVSERVRQCLLRDDIVGAVRHASDAGLPKSAAQVLPNGSMTTKQEAIAATWVRIAIATGAYKDALRVLRQWVAFAESRACVRTQIRMEILLARAYYTSGDTRAALRTIKQATDAGARIGLYFSFLEEGEPVKSLIVKMLQINGDVSDVRRYAHHLIAALGSELSASRHATDIIVSPPVINPNLHDAPCEPLNPREMEILKFVAQSMLNKEIADRLGMTEGSVKWYLQQIYGKLGVRRRQMALNKARQMGYLH